MKLEDMLLSRAEVDEKYKDAGSIEYPTHPRGCPCSGCYASWTEWRGAHELLTKLRESHVIIPRSLAHRAAAVIERANKRGIACYTCGADLDVEEPRHGETCDAVTSAKELRIELARQLQ